MIDEKKNNLELDELKNLITVPKDGDKPENSGYDYIWGSDQDDLVEDKEG